MSFVFSRFPTQDLEMARSSCRADVQEVEKKIATAEVNDWTSLVLLVVYSKFNILGVWEWLKKIFFKEVVILTQNFDLALNLNCDHHLKCF